MTLVHLEEFKSAESATRMMSGNDENVEALSSDVCYCGERQTMSNLMTCSDVHQLHVDRPGYVNPCRCEFYQTLGGKLYKHWEEK